MTADAITSNDDDITPCDNYGGITKRSGPVCEHQVQLDHMDTMLHDSIKRLAALDRRMAELDPLLPLIPRVQKLLGPKKWGMNAIPQRTSAPVHVREASEDSGPVGT